MGSPPPPDGPSPAAQQQASADASFAPGPPVAQLCGFKLPSLQFSFGFTLPPLAFPPKPPDLSGLVAIGLNCSADNPIDVVGDLPWGGGRVATYDPDPDDLVDQQTG